MLYRAVETTFEIETNFEVLDSILVWKLKSDTFRSERDITPTDDIIFTLYPTADDIPFGGFIIKKSNEIFSELLVTRYGVGGDEKGNDDRIDRLRTVVFDLVSNLKKNPKVGLIRNYDEALSWLQRPLTTQEREERESREREKRKARQEQGFYSRRLFNTKCRTSPQFVEAIIKRYQLDKIQEDNTFWKAVQIKNFSGATSLATYNIFLEKLDIAGILGQVDVEPINDIEAIIKITTMDDIIPFISEETATSLYFEALQELTALSKCLATTYGVEIKPASENTPGSDNKVIKKHQNEKSEQDPWEWIPNHLWDRDAVKMWWEGSTNNEIANRVNVADRRVTNRLSELRQKFGEDIVPYDEQRKHHLLKKIRDMT